MRHAEVHDRSIWTGHLRVAELVIPVGLVKPSEHPARPASAAPGVHDPVREKRVCPAHDSPVPEEELVRGFELAEGQYLPIEASELEAIAPEATRILTVTHVVTGDLVDELAVALSG